MSDILKANALMKEMLKASTSKNMKPMTLTEYFKIELPFFNTNIPIMNLLMSGSLTGGMYAGIHAIAGASKNYKSTFGIMNASTFLNTYPEGIVLFFDSEGGTPKTYWEAFGADSNRVLYCAITDIEELTSVLMQMLDKLPPDAKVLILIDSLGNTASNKEREDSLKGEKKVDMTRAKAIKGFWRQLTTPIKNRQLWCIPIQHTYKEQSLYPKDVVSGGTGNIYSADNIWIVGRSQEKGDDEIRNETNVVIGYNFNFVVHKSRTVKENLKFPLEVRYNTGINKYSGLFELGLQTGFIVKVGNQYTRPHIDLKGEKMFKKHLDANPVFFEPLLELAEFHDKVNSMFTLEQPTLFHGKGDDIEEVVIDENVLYEGMSEADDSRDEIIKHIAR